MKPYQESLEISDIDKSFVESSEYLGMERDNIIYFERQFSKIFPQETKGLTLFKLERHLSQNEKLQEAQRKSSVKYLDTLLEDTLLEKQ